MIYYKIPATSANMGPGFDCMGMAFDMYNIIGMQETDSGLSIEMRGIGSENLPTDKSNLAFTSAKYFFDNAGYSPKGLKIKIHNDIPIARGLGSSSSIIIGAMLCANEMAKTGLEKTEILNIASKLETHPDNIAPAMLGGIVVGAVNESGIMCKKILPKHDLAAVCLIPSYEIKTDDARKILPQDITMSDSIHNISRLSLMLLSLQDGDYETLKKSCSDRLHQPYRKNLIKEYDEFMDISKRYGSIASFISGSGSTLMSLCKKENANFLHEKLCEKFVDGNSKNAVKILHPDLNGACRTSEI